MQCLIWNQLQCPVHQQVLVNPSERVNDPIPPLYVRMAAIEGLADQAAKVSGKALKGQLFTVAEANAGEFQLVIVVL